jgi:hypothetical protein
MAGVLGLEPAEENADFFISGGHGLCLDYGKDILREKAGKVQRRGGRAW